MKKMTPRQIKHALDDAGYTQVMIAEACDVKQPAVSLVIYNKGTSHKIRCAIAKAIGRDVNELWDIKDNPTKVGRPSSIIRHHSAA